VSDKADLERREHVRMKTLAQGARRRFDAATEQVYRDRLNA
jgi:hypothetical protein